MKLRRIVIGVAAVLVIAAAASVASAWHQGYRAYVVHTGSMVPAFRPGDAVWDKPATSRYSVGDPITVGIGGDQRVTHRLIKIDKQGLLHTKGDANRTPDVWALPPSRVQGVVDRVLPKMGYVLIFLHQRTGVAGVMTSALSLILLWGICFPGEQETPAPPAPPRVPRQRRPFARIPRQRTPGQVSAPVSDAALLMTERRLPPGPPPVRTGATDAAAVPVDACAPADATDRLTSGRPRRGRKLERPPLPRHGGRRRTSLHRQGCPACPYANVPSRDVGHALPPDGSLVGRA